MRKFYVGLYEPQLDIVYELAQKERETLCADFNKTKNSDLLKRIELLNAILCAVNFKK